MSANEISDIVVVGDPTRTFGRLPHYRLVDSAADMRFDNATDTWTVTTGDGQTVTGQILVDTTPRDDDAVAAYGVPNRFRIPGPHTARQARYVARIIDGLHRSHATRIEAHSSIRVHPVLPTRGLSRFYLTGSVGVDDETYDGPAVITHDGHEYDSRVRLTGHFDPIDGQYHWQGTLHTDLAGARVTGSTVDIRIGEHTAVGRISEQTPWGTLAVVGAAGYPPFPLEDVEIAMPPRR